MRLNGTVFSKTLGMDTGITIVTPNELREKYKVVYLLHGIKGNSRTWIDYSMLSMFARQGNTVYIMPEVQRSFYTDMLFGLKYFTYITEELPNICKNIFNISAKREDTAVMGCSMGGYGALKCALSKPEQYGMCGAFSSCCLFLKEGMEETRKFGMDPKFIARFGEELITDLKLVFGYDFEWNPKDDILELARNISESRIKPKLYLACGKEDMFYSDHLRFAEEMKKLDFEFEFEAWNANHDFVCFNEALKRAIEKFEQ